MTVKKTKAATSKRDKLSEKFSSFRITIGDVRESMSVVADLTLDNPENPAEVVAKMNVAPGRFFWLGSLKTFIQGKLDAEKLGFDVWFETKKHAWKNEKSERAMERRVIVDNEAEYRKRKTRINSISKVYNEVRQAKNAYEKHIAMLQSIGRQLTEEKRVPDPDKFDIKNKSIKEHGALGDTLSKRSKK